MKQKFSGDIIHAAKQILRKRQRMRLPLYPMIKHYFSPPFFLVYIHSLQYLIFTMPFTIF